MLRLLGPALPALRWQAIPAAAVALAASRGAKTTTGIVGLPADPEARTHLQEKLREVLDSLKVIPQTAGYRQAVEATVAHRLGLAESDLADEQIEETLGMQLEQAIKACNDELGLIPKMAGEHGGMPGAPQGQGGRRRANQAAERVRLGQIAVPATPPPAAAPHPPPAEWAPWDVPEGHKVGLCGRVGAARIAAATAAAAACRAWSARSLIRPPPPAASPSQIEGVEEQLVEEAAVAAAK
jgi:NADH dehydrogenase (ubiquinone) 1 alpha subcomplex subunit 5